MYKINAKSGTQSQTLSYRNQAGGINFSAFQPAMTSSGYGHNMKRTQTPPPKNFIEINKKAVSPDNCH